MGATDLYSSNYLNALYYQPEKSNSTLSAALQRPPLENLPQDVQDFISHISDLEGYEQAALIHQYTASKIAFSTNNQALMSFEQVLAAGAGDCNDIAIFQAALLQYAGVAPENIGIFSGVVGYYTGADITGDHEITEDMELNARLLHSYLVLDNEGQFLLLDSNAEGIADLKESVANINALDEHGNNIPVKFLITEVDQITLTNGQVHVAKSPSAMSIEASNANMTPDGPNENGQHKEAVNAPSASSS